MSKTIGLVLAGCGVFDGAEIHEAVMAMLALEKKGYTIQCVAPNIEQAHVVNHYEGRVEETPEHRNVLIEASRIARGKIKALEEVSAADFDGLFFPGGFGAAKNLSSFAFDGPEAKVHDGLQKLIKDCHSAGKPMAFVCIAPVIAAKVIGNGVELTIGNNADVAAQIEAMGAKHIEKKVDEAHVDEKNKIVTAPAYMFELPISEIEKSVHAAVDEFAKLLG